MVIAGQLFPPSTSSSDSSHKHTILRIGKIISIIKMPSSPSITPYDQVMQTISNEIFKTIAINDTDLHQPLFPWNVATYIFLFTDCCNLPYIWLSLSTIFYLWDHNKRDNICLP